MDTVRNSTGLRVLLAQRFGVLHADESFIRLRELQDRIDGVDLVGDLLVGPGELPMPQEKRKHNGAISSAWAYLVRANLAEATDREGCLVSVLVPFVRPYRPPPLQRSRTYLAARSAPERWPGIPDKAAVKINSVRSLFTPRRHGIER